MVRRDFLKLLASLSLLPACAERAPAPRIGLALGGGGARGLSHIPMLEVFDQLGLRPHRIAGASIGAIIGALYASGMSGQRIRKLVDELTVSGEESWLESLFSEDIGRWFDFFEPELGRGGLVDSGPFIAYLHEQLQLSDFSQLQTPLKVVAADFWQREQVVFESGDLLSAVQASMAIPGLFEPVAHRGRVLVDGGLINPVPYDLLLEECDLVVAVDVIGKRTPQGDDGPGYFETTFNTFQIMQSAIMREKRQRHMPDIYLEPAIENVRVLEFFKADEIYSQAAAEAARLRRWLQEKRGASAQAVAV